jgi:predicted NACHT family NTPase
MDGLNEMPLDTRSKRAKALKAFLQKQEVAIPTIVTCRVEDYEQDRDLFFDLPAVHIQDLDSPRIEEFLDKRKKGELWDELKKESNSNLRELARNPYKLVMLIEVFDSHRKQLPASLNELYEGRNRLRQNVIQLRRAVIQLRTGLPKA